MRTFAAVFVVAIVACSSNPPRAVTGGAPASGDGPRLDLHCTPQADFDEPNCAARGDGCGYAPPLICRGIDVDDATHEAERAAYEAGTQPCTCICSADREACAMVP